jgi:hypothetical protein
MVLEFEDGLFNIFNKFSKRKIKKEEVAPL